MFATRSLLQHCRITFFSRQGCLNCKNARHRLGRTWYQRNFFFKEIDLDKPESKEWHKLYDLHAPVVHLALNDAPEETPSDERRKDVIKIKVNISKKQVLREMEQLAGPHTKNRMIDGKWVGEDQVGVLYKSGVVAGMRVSKQSK